MFTKWQKCSKRFGLLMVVAWYCHPVPQGDMSFSLFKGVWTKWTVYLFQNDTSKTTPSFFHFCCFSALSIRIAWLDLWHWVRIWNWPLTWSRMGPRWLENGCKSNTLIPLCLINNKYLLFIQAIAMWELLFTVSYCTNGWQL